MLNELAKEVHQNAVEHGWWEENRSFGEIIALCHSELSEALEEYRNGHEPKETYFECKADERDWEYCNGDLENCKGCEHRSKPEGIPSELADCIIRILDYCGKKEVSLLNSFYDKDDLNIELKNFGDFIALWHVFISKAYEEPYRWIYWLSCAANGIMQYCTENGIDIDEAIRTKHEYNKTRPYRHGGKVI